MLVWGIPYADVSDVKIRNFLQAIAKPATGQFYKFIYNQIVWCSYCMLTGCHT